MLISQVAIFFEGAVDELFEFRWQVGIKPHRRHRASIQDSFENYPRSVAAKWQGARGHFVEHDSKRKQVGARIQCLPLDLLWRHVRDRAQSRTRTCECFVSRDRRAYRRASAFDNVA